MARYKTLLNFCYLQKRKFRVHLCSSLSNITEIRFSAEVTFSVLHSIEIGSGFYPAFYLVDTRGKVATDLRVVKTKP